MFSSNPIFGNDIFTYILSFAYQDTYQLALVSKRFYQITRSKTYWKYIAHHCLKYLIPKRVLLEVNFFYGLERNNPPHYYLWSLVKGSDENLTLSNCSLDLQSQHTDQLLITWRTLPEQNLPANYFSLTTWDKIKNAFFMTFFNHPRWRKMTTKQQVDSRLVITYSEFWDSAHERIWCGLAKEDDSFPGAKIPDNPEAYEPFGVWIKAEEQDSLERLE